MQRVVVRTITNMLSHSCDPDFLHFCAMVVKNLTVLENVRAYLDDQVAAIAMDIMGRVSDGSNDTVMLCAAILFNCLGFKQSRIRMADGNIICQCRRLFGFCSSDAQHSCTLLLAELSRYDDVTNRLLNGGILQLFSSNLSSSDPRSGECKQIDTKVNSDSNIPAKCFSTDMSTLVREFCDPTPPYFLSSGDVCSRPQ